MRFAICVVVGLSCVTAFAHQRVAVVRADAVSAKMVTGNAVGNFLAGTNSVQIFVYDRKVSEACRGKTAAVVAFCAKELDSLLEAAKNEDAWIVVDPSEQQALPRLAEVF